MKKLTLNFSDFSLESSYQKSNKPFVIKTLSFCFQMQIIYCLIMITLVIIKSGFSSTRMAALFVVLCFLVLFLILKKFMHQKKFFELFLILFCYTIDIFAIESIKSVQGLDGRTEIASVFMAMMIQFFLDITLFTRISWYYSSLGYIINVLYLMGRLIIIDSPFTADIFSGVFLLIIIFPLISYRQEKTYREYFKLLHDSYENLKKFKEIIQSVLPSPIFVLNYEEKSLEFLNSSSCKLLKKEFYRSGNYADSQFFMEYSSASPIQNKKSSLAKFEEFLKNFKILKKKEDNLGLDLENLSISEVIKKFCLFKQKKEISQFILDFMKDDFLNFHIIRKQIEEETNNILVHPKGLSKTAYYEVRISTLNWDNKPCIIIIFNNQTKAKRVIELMNLDNYKNQMLATISHDLRTPLNGIIGMITSVFSNILDKESRKNLKVAIASAHLLSYLINDILDFSQMAYKKLRISCEKIDILEMFNEIFKMIKFQARKKKIFFLKEVNLHNKRFFFSDPIRIKQILLNLLGNALKFTREGGSIILKVEHISGQFNDILKFSVADTGIGIKEEDKGKLFVLFGKLEIDDPEMNKTGIGFGLTISQNLAKMLYSGPDSGIIVESEYGKGSTFSFKVSSEMIAIREDFAFSMINEEKSPLLQYNSTHKSMSERNHENITNFFLNNGTHKSKPKQYCRALIVDDDPVNVMILEKYMEYYKIDYISAANGMEAVAIIENEVIINKKEFAFILMDCNMPIMNGFKASERINELLQKNHLKEIPIIAVTANVTNADKELCFKSGMKNFVTKPVSRDDLGLLIRDFLKINLEIPLNK